MNPENNNEVNIVIATLKKGIEKAEASLAQVSINEIATTGALALLMMLTLAVGWGAGKSLERQQAIITSLQKDLIRTSDELVSLKGEMVSMRLAAGEVEKKATKAQESRDMRLDGLSKMAVDARDEISDLSRVVTCNANKTALEISTLSDRVAGAGEVGRVGLLTSSQLGCMIGSVMMKDRVETSAKVMAPLLEPVSWYNPTEAAPISPEVVKADESWTSRIRAKLAAITK